MRFFAFSPFFLSLVSFVFLSDSSSAAEILNSGLPLPSCFDHGRTLPSRNHVASITDFGGVGDGVTLNTNAFRSAVYSLRSQAFQGGVQLNVPKGRWITGSFNLTSHFTLYLEKDAEIVASEDIRDWPVIEPLPSYGRGRERPGGRYISLIHGQNLVDVVITGENGIIDGRGAAWWERWYDRTLMYTRGHLVEFISSQNIIISNVVMRNSPFWTVHPVYCNDVIVKNVSIFAPRSSPNTDGVDPDSCTNVCIEDCYISNGDDLVALKSGWDEYGISVGKPSSNITIRRIVGTTPFSGISIGSEMSGGIKNVYVEDIHVFNTGTGIRVKTAPGRGGYVTNVTVTRMRMDNVSKAIDITEDAGEHPDDSYDPNAIPLVKGITIKDIVGRNVASAGRFLGLMESPLSNIYLSRIYLSLLTPMGWTCSHVEGVAYSVSPAMCSSFQQSEADVVSEEDSLYDWGSNHWKH